MVSPPTRPSVETRRPATPTSSSAIDSTRQVGIAQGGSVLDKRPHRQVVLSKGFAVGVVGQRIHPDGVGRAPCGFGQFLDRAERLFGENRTTSRLDRDERGIG